MVARLISLAAIMIGSQALAHEHWISRESLRDPDTLEWCCNEHDCKEVTGVRRIGESGHYVIPATGEVIHKRRVIWRSPGGWWQCVSTQLDGTERTRCLIGPPNAM